MAGPPPNVFGFTTPSPQTSFQRSSSQYLSNANFASRSFSSADFPSQSNSSFHNPFSSNSSPSSYTTHPNVSGGSSTLYSLSPTSSPSVIRHKVDQTSEKLKADLIQDEVEPTPIEETNSPASSPMSQPKHASSSSPSNLSANYAFITQLNSPSTRDVKSSDASGGGDAPRSNGDEVRAEVWAMLSQLAKK